MIIVIIIFWVLLGHIGGVIISCIEDGIHREMSYKKIFSSFVYKQLYKESSIVSTIILYFLYLCMGMVVLIIGILFYVSDKAITKCSELNYLKLRDGRYISFCINNKYFHFSIYYSKTDGYYVQNKYNFYEDSTSIFEELEIIDPLKFNSKYFCNKYNFSRKNIPVFKKRGDLRKYFRKLFELCEERNKV